MADEYATLRAAEAAGARIQAWTLRPDLLNVRRDGPTSADGYWRTIEGPAKFTCPVHLYRVHPEDVA